MSVAMKPAPTTTRHLRSLAQLCGDLRHPFAAVARVVRERGIEPAVTIDGLAYFDEQGAEAIRRALDPSATDRDRNAG